MRTVLYSFALTVLLTSTANARDLRPTVVVSAKAVVQGSNIRLEDIARVKSKEPEHKQLVEELRRITISESPAPKTKKVLMGAEILKSIVSAGYETELFGYSIPHNVEVERAGRTIKKTEVLEAARRSFMEDESLDLKIREVSWTNNYIVPLGETEFKIEHLGRPSAGRVPLRIGVIVNGEYSARFLATAVADDWREVPVMTRSVERGMLISSEDIQLVRLNLLKEPKDVLEGVSQVVGRRVKTRLRAGNTIRRNQVDIPPMVPRGDWVKMHYRKGGLHVTGKGKALEDGHYGGVISVRNTSSRKVVRGKVVANNEIEVTAP